MPIKAIEKSEDYPMSGKPILFHVDRSTPFNPANLGDGWSIFSQDERALKIVEIDFAKVQFESAITDAEPVWTFITGKEKLRRLTAMPAIRLDFQVIWALYEEPGQTTLRRIYDELLHPSEYIECMGTIFHGQTVDYQVTFGVNRMDHDGSWRIGGGPLKNGGRARGIKTPLIPLSAL